jgi:hypothetical protein
MSDLHRPDDSAHPDEALAGFVDGTLTAAERADVQAHLDGCERCRAQVAQAQVAAEALRSLPELDAPWGLGKAAIEEARKQAGRTSNPDRSRRVAWVAGIAAAVVLVAGLSVALLRAPSGGGAASQGPATTGATSGAQPVAGGSEARSFATSNSFLQRSAFNFNATDVSRLAQDAAHADRTKLAPVASTAPVSGPGTSGAATSAPPPTGGVKTNAESIGPVACLDTAAEYTPETRPIHVIDARYEEKPALIGIFLQGSNPTRRADLVVVWVASKDTCQVLSYASSSLAQPGSSTP